MWPLGVLKKTDLLTLLNLRFNGVHGSQVFTDSSYYNRIFSVVSGSPSLSTTESISGGSGLYLGVNGSIQTPHFTDCLSSSEYTVEFWIKPDLATFANGTEQGVFIKGFSSDLAQNYSHYCRIARDASGNTGDIRFYWLDPQAGQPSSFVRGTLNLTQWNHVAFVRYISGDYRCYINGVVQQTVFSPQLQTNTLAFFVGASLYSWSLGANIPKFTGYLENFKLTKKALYSFNFTPPT